MDLIQLREDYNLGFEFEDKRVRLIVFKNGFELGCRKEKIKIVEDFILNKEPKLFKGRLQLFKKENEIIVSFKDEVIGHVYIKEFQRKLNNRLLLNT